MTEITPSSKRRKQATKAELEERRARALYLNVRGRSYEKIAELSRLEEWTFPYASRQAVYEDVQAALKSRRLERAAAVDEWIQAEIEKLDAMEWAAWDVLESLHYVVNQGEVVYVYPDEQPDFVKRGWARPKLDLETRWALESKRAEMAREPLTDNKPVLDALIVLLKIAERRAKLLGYDAPVKKQVEVKASGNLDQQISALVAELAGGREIAAAAGIAADQERSNPADPGTAR